MNSKDIIRLINESPRIGDGSVKINLEGVVYVRNNIQKAIDQVGYEAVMKSMGGIQLGNCTMHGQYAMVSDGTCPICPNPNGTTPTEVEHYINIKDMVDPASGANPGQVINPTGITEQDIKSAKDAIDNC